MQGTVLVLGANSNLTTTLELLLDGVRVRHAHTAAETEGLGVDVVVVAGDYPLEELSEVRVHPLLFEKPVVLVAPGRPLHTQDWRGFDIWPVTDCGPGVLDEILELVGVLLTKGRHPSRRQPAPAFAAQAAS
jgi:hypothetical protein